MKLSELIPENADWNYPAFERTRQEKKRIDALASRSFKPGELVFQTDQSHAICWQIDQINSNWRLECHDIADPSRIRILSPVHTRRPLELVNDYLGKALGWPIEVKEPQDAVKGLKVAKWKPAWRKDSVLAALKILYPMHDAYFRKIADETQ